MFSKTIFITLIVSACFALTTCDGNHWVKEITEPLFTCERKGHKWGGLESIEVHPSCSETGIGTKKCEKCEIADPNAVIPTLPHDPYHATGMCRSCEEYVTTHLVVYDTINWSEACDTIKSYGSGKSYTITVRGNFDVAGSTSATFDTVTDLSVTITGNHTISLETGTTGNLLNISDGQSVTINDLDLVGGTNNTALVDVRGAVLPVSASLTMNGSASVSGNNNNGSNGGGVVVYYGIFTMNGSASVHGNTAGQYGGGVYAGGGSSFIMNGGEIYSNTTAVRGGGVYLVGGGNLFMYGGTIYGSKTNEPAKGNTAPAGSQALYVSSGSQAYYGEAGIILSSNSGTDNTIRAENGLPVP